MSNFPQMSRASAFGRWLRRRAENVMVLLLSVMFATFIIQIFARYALNNPIGWSEEVIITAWLWTVLWGAAFVVSEAEEILCLCKFHESRTLGISACADQLVVFDLRHFSRRVHLPLLLAGRRRHPWRHAARHGCSKAERLACQFHPSPFASSRLWFSARSACRSGIP
jgi:hypothetical protein